MSYLTKWELISYEMYIKLENDTISEYKWKYGNIYGMLNMVMEHMYASNLSVTVKSLNVHKGKGQWTKYQVDKTKNGTKVDSKLQTIWPHKTLEILRGVYHIKYITRELTLNWMFQIWE